MSSAEATFARRVIVISDLHLGGSKSVMMSRPGRLVRFLRGLPHQAKSDEKLELVIAGDFVDFLTIDPLASWTPKPDVARKKLNDTMDGELFGPVFDALLELVRSGCALTILLGNHDLELALPVAQEALWRRLSADPHQVLFLVDGRAYRVGGLLIEHGNRYDGANANDWEASSAPPIRGPKLHPSPCAPRLEAGSSSTTSIPLRTTIHSSISYSRRPNSWRCYYWPSNPS
jgi:calcineurin-like phosphoesterase family protein